jgi:CRP-like cAMP-binding protein
MALDPFWSNLFRRRDPEREALFNVLKGVPIFQDLSRGELRKVLSILHRRTWAADEAIVREGDPGVGMYIIASGEVQILQAGADGTLQQLATLGSGDFFGEQALLDESPRTASAIAAEPCRVIGFFRPDLLELIESEPRLGLKIVMRLSQMISVRLRHTNRLLKEARLRAKQAELEKLQAERALEEKLNQEAAATDSQNVLEATKAGS